MFNKKRLLIAGGGTGGHVLSGVAIAQEWQRVNGENSVLFVGARGRIEEDLVPRSGFKVRLLPIGSLNRVSVFRKIKTAFQLPIAFFLSAFYLLLFRPHAVIGVGGYASGPVLLVASLIAPIFRWKTAILEQNSVPGLTNKILGKRVQKVFAAFPNLSEAFPRAVVVETGNPVVQQMEPLAPSPLKPFVILITGGSQGAVGINSLVLDALRFLESRKDEIKIIHQTGVRDYERVLEGYSKTTLNREVSKFIYDMKAVYSAASIVICRAGASTLSELAIIGRASILIPLPTASDNHQEKNAKVYSDAGAAVLLPQERSKGRDLADLIFSLMDHPEKLRKFEGEIAKFYKPGAAREIVENFLGDRIRA